MRPPQHWRRCGRRASRACGCDSGNSGGRLRTASTSLRGRAARRRRCWSRSCSSQSSGCSTRSSSPSSIDLRHFSLHPWDGSRSALFGGLLAIHLAALWTATLIFVAAPSRWRLPSQRWPLRLLLLACWVLPTAAGRGVRAGARDARVPPLGLLLSGVTCGVAALVGRRIAELVQTRDSGRAHPVALRRVPDPGAPALPVDQLSRGARHAAADHDAIRFEAQNHVTRLQEHTLEARSEIDRDPRLPGLVSEAAAQVGPCVQLVRRFRDLAADGAESRTSDVRDRALQRRGRLRQPVRAELSRVHRAARRSTPASGSCKWEMFGEAQPFGSEERNMLHAERSICDASRHRRRHASSCT